MAGIYIHIPFCKQACSYCNFHFSTSQSGRSDLVNAIAREIRITEMYEGDDTPVSTVYFGGGTPSLLTTAELSDIMDALHKKFAIDDKAEITLEANPDDVSHQRVKEWMGLGINRMSVGLQSFNDAELKWMNRAHNAEQSLRCIHEIQEAGIDNLSVDLIYGSPLLSREDLEKSVTLIAENKIPHISCYALTVEPKTALNHLIAQKKSPGINSEEQASQFLLLMNCMKENEYEHYEISNYAKAGMRSVHNSSYWQGKPYYGFGPSAHSFDGFTKRRWNIYNNALYTQSIKKGIIPYEEEILTDQQRLNEYIMTALRTKEGIDMNFVEELFGKSKAEILLQQTGKYMLSNKMVRNDHLLSLTNEGKLFADGIAADLFH
ncbi:MAG: radical SAM family heme chaperone HemW [Bacteroidetes bacterium]|nr:radical SAM family heme chaperone HemW [Bacteroidota bacterium]